MREEHRIKNTLTKFSTHTIWFERFVRGVDLRDGNKSSPYQSIRIEVMKLLMKKIEVELKEKVSMLERRYLTKKVAYFMSCFVASLRGREWFIIDVAGLWHHIRKRKRDP